MRPISLTSCVDKLIEHACLNRGYGYLDSNNVYRSHIIGFRRGLSMQDAMVLLRQRVIDNTERGMMAVIGLYLRKAFSMVEHTAIFEIVSQLGLGERTYKYIKIFYEKNCQD
ncbi:uncharacterized protein LOC142802820 [Rhipicephalus microplus]|uniref:uncharacterized protein LOC142802820 n=1 Tax=Rhipicephalus microplus TaxID=6941 RepID=UPI003F6B53F7